MAVGTAAVQRAWLRRQVCHQADTALISDDLLDDALDAALLATNRHWPLLLFGSFTTVAEQQIYTPLPAGAYKLLKVYWPIVCANDEWWTFEFVPEVEGLLGEVDEFGFTYPLGASLQASFFRHREYLDRFFGGQARIQDPGTVRLIPRPSEAGNTVFFLYSTPQFATVEDVAEAQEEYYRAYAQFQLHNVLSTGRGALQQVTSPLGVGIRTRASIAHTAAADRWEQRAMSLLQMLPTSRHSP